jgi:hypothetical protein
MMLYRPTVAEAAIPVPPREIVGRCLGKLTPTQAALLALDLERGGACVRLFRPRQAQRFCNANRLDVSALRRASAEELERVERGELDLSKLRHKPPPSDRVIAQLGAGLGGGVWMIPAGPPYLRERALGDLICELEQVIQLLDTVQALADANDRIGPDRFDDAMRALGTATDMLNELRLAQ